VTGSDSPVKADYFHAREVMRKKITMAWLIKSYVILTNDDNGKNLIDLQRIPLKEACICRYNVSQFNTDNISWYKNGCLFLSPSAITKHLNKSKLVQTSGRAQ
jgi:hypothetical protein